MSGIPPGETLGGRFLILGALGDGGMATVYLAQDQLRDERVALKVLHPHLATSPSMRARLRREVHAASRLKHPNALVAHELHELDGRLALSMPVCAGATLADHVAAKGPLSAAALQRLGAELCAALAHAHSVGVVHRDVTPTNAMLEPDGRALLMDFGLARLDGGRSATGTGVLGTAGYAAPEVYDRVRGDPRSDLYSLGALLYFAATGDAPFAAPSPMASLRRQLADDRRPLAELRPELPPHLIEAIEGMLQVDPEARPPGALAAQHAIEGRPSASSAPLPTPPPLHDAPAAVAPRLPAGAWAVELRESERLDQERRARLRRGLDPHGEGLEGVLKRVFTEIAQGVRSAFAMPEDRPIEEQLIAAVARQAELPPEALRAPDALLERHFILVSGVNEETAQALAETSRLLGFRATLTRRSGSPPPDLAKTLGAVAVLLLLAALFQTWLFVSFAMLVLLMGGTSAIHGAQRDAYQGAQQRAHQGAQQRARHQVHAKSHLPQAFRADLRGALTPPYLEALEALEQRIQQPEPPLYGPTAAPPPLERAPPVAQRAAEQLDALEASLKERADELPKPVLDDLTRSLHQLRARCAALGARARRLGAELERSADGQDAAAAAARIESRLERLRTLSAMGQVADPQERSTLEAALVEHRASMVDQERLESEKLRVLAELLHIHASAGRARRALLEEGDVVSSATDLLGELRGQVDAARAAATELETDAERRARARSAEAKARR